MPTQKEKLAIDAIRDSIGTEAGEYGIDLFIEHHLEELSNSDWKKSLGIENPSKEQVLDGLILRSSWDDDCVYDFTLPKEVTDCVVSVRFDEGGEIEDISMES